MSNPLNIDIGNLCTHCGRDTASRSDELLFVNRIPSGADGLLVFANGVTAEESGLIVSLEGYMCVDCQSQECDKCGESTLDYEILDLPIPELLCTNCLEKVEVKKESE